MNLPEFDLFVVEGASYDLLVTLSENGVAVPLTGYTFEGTVKESYADNASLRATMTCSIVDAAKGQVKLSLTKTQTAGLFPNASELRGASTAGVWDVFYNTPSGARHYLLGGKVRFRQTSTKAGGV